MREPPPAQLTALLTQLGLATDQEFASVEDNVQRMAGDLPRFESVWVDALRQARFLTHFQAAEIHAGRGQELKVGRYVLCQPVQECGYSSIYRAVDRKSREIVRIAVFPAQSEDSSVSSTRSVPDSDMLEQLERLCAAGRGMPRFVGSIESAGFDGSQAWAASPWVDGISLADWMLHHGRFPSDVVLEIARAMLGELSQLEAAGLTHGDIRLRNVLMAKEGDVSVPHPGLRGVIRPQEGISHHDLAPDAVSTLAPERVTLGTPPTAASDLFACGCAWWHMICGRSPLGGGDTLARLRAAQAAAIEDLRQWAGHVPDLLADAIRDCLQKDPRQRPKSIAELAERLGPLRRPGGRAIARCLASAARPRAPWLRSNRDRAKKKRHPHRLTAAAIAILAAIAVAWPIWVARTRPRATIADVRQSFHPDLTKPMEPSHQRIADPAVIPASHFEDRAVGQIANLPDNRQFGNLPHDELCLPSDRPVRAGTLQLKPGLRVRAQSGRARIVVPREGLAVLANRVSFENIDFIAEDRVEPRAIRVDSSAALVRLQAAECDFAGCSFQSASPAAPEPKELSAAIIWERVSSGKSAGAAEIGMTSELSLDLPSGRIRIKDCVFRRVLSGVDASVRGAISLELVNCLHLGPGPIIRLSHAPAVDEPVHIHLSQVTLRDGLGLLTCRSMGPDSRSGEIGIEASGCVLAPRMGAALLMLRSDDFPRQLLREVKWTGQGSVVAGQVVFGTWSRLGDVTRTIDDSTISIAGLVRGEVEFAGRLDGEPASSRVVNCQAPLQDSPEISGAGGAGAAVRNLPPEIK